MYECFVWIYVCASHACWSPTGEKELDPLGIGVTDGFFAIMWVLETEALKEQALCICNLIL